KKQSFKTMSQEMGYREELHHFVDVIRGKVEAQISPAEIFYSTQPVFDINHSLEKGTAINVTL
ncbi:MAG: hypothetical protein WCJ37_20965, partial [Syntrophus sp. (in: bacteria)]